MRTDVASLRWTPLGLQSARWFGWISLVSLLIMFVISWMRTDGYGMNIAILAIFCNSIIIYLVPEDAPEDRSRLRLSLFISCSVMVLSSSLLFLSHRESSSIGITIIDFWISSPVFLASILSLFSGMKSWRWFVGEHTKSEAIEGLSRSRKYGPRILQISKQIVLLHLGLFAILPPLWTLMLSLTPGNSLGGDFKFSSITLEHYDKIIGMDRFWIWLRNSIIVSVGTTIFGLSIAFPAAYGFSRYRFHGRKLGLFVFLIVQMFPGALILVPYFIVMKGFGLLNSFIGLMLAYSVTALPLCVWLMKGFFDTIPIELEEAARVDGCSQLQVFIHIIFPLSLPAVAITCLFSFLAAWNEFLLALTFLSDSDKYTMPVGIASMVSETQPYWGDFAAASILVSLPVVLLFITFQRYLVDGMVAGSVKG